MPKARKSTKSDPVSAPEQAPVAPALTPDEVARRAYEIYERSGFEGGRDLDHWLSAERELQGY